MIAKVPTPLSHINLQGGWPTPRLHPVAAVEAACSSVSHQKDITKQLMYGPEHGSLSLRNSIGQWLNETYSPPAGSIPAERILVTNGASNGLATLLQKFTDPVYTRAIWMVEPTYFLACPIFRDAGLAGRIKGAPEGRDGVDLDFLRKALEDVDEKGDNATLPAKSPKNGYPKVYRHIIYLIPTFSNPSGKTMSLESRKGLIGLARKHDALVVSDDVYDVLRWPTDASMSIEDLGPCPPRLVDVDRNLEGTTAFGNAVSNGSFSKIVAPGMRVGWLEGSLPLIAAMATVGATVSGGCQSHFASLVVGQMLASGALTRHIHEVLIPTYRERYYAMTTAIDQYLGPLGVKIVALEDVIAGGFAGGFFLYLSFDGCGRGIGAEVAKVALEQFDLRIAPGNIFAVPDDLESVKRCKLTYSNGARLCWAWNEEEVLVEGIHRLAEAIETAMARES